MTTYGYAHYMRVHTRFDLVRNAEKIVEAGNAPYSHVSYEDLKGWRDLLDEWQRDPQNDCCRARGDSVWHKATELINALDALMLPF